MSVIEKVNFKCPHCECVFESDMYKSVIVQENKEFRSMLLNGKFFKFTCPDCGKEFVAFYPLSYADMDNKFIIQFAPRQNQEEVLTFMKEHRNEFPTDYTLRFVANSYDVVEKMLIFENRFDDRAIECMKVVIHKAFLDKFENCTVKHIYLNYSNDNKVSFDCLFTDENKEDKISRANFDIKLYNRIYHDFRKDFKDSDLVVDYGYGLRLMSRPSEQ